MSETKQGVRIEMAGRQFGRLSVTALNQADPTWFEKLSAGQTMTVSFSPAAAFEEGYTLVTG